jgi:hypothetical protein
MSERFSWKKVSVASMAVFVIFLMIVSGFSGAIGSEKTSEPTNGSGGEEAAVDPSGPEGVRVVGDQSDALEIPSSDITATDGISDAYGGPEILNDLSSTGSLGADINEDKEPANFDDATEAIAHFNEVGLENNVISYNSVLNDVVSQYVSSEQVSVSSHGEIDSDITTNLYDTVSDYFEDDAERSEPGLEEAFSELSNEGLTPELEILEKRTADSKSFRNDDGTITAILFEKPVHYQDSEGNWQDINLNLEMAIQTA